MSSTVISVEHLSKQYRLGTVGRKSLKDDLNRWYHRMRGEEDPFLKIGEENDRSVKGATEYVWALQDISFDVQQGEVLGIIGKNGAGKSTLLKILSKITSPTTGEARIKGRIASLLEVGTGFHGELSGRENIFLNGAILGMNKREIRGKLDAIIDFAGVERYIDTPVKRYSSGMYVRLAFAVAAHLEPDIIIVDEVLAVGDAEFQEKCLGKMKDVSEKDGRTVLFVSHNMGAIQSLCEKCLLLKNGRVQLIGSISDVVSSYIESEKERMVHKPIHKQIDDGAIIKGFTFFVGETVLGAGDYVLMGQSLTIQITVQASEFIKDLSVAIDIKNIHEELYSHLINEDGKMAISNLQPGEERTITIRTAPLHFAPGYFHIDLWIGNYHNNGYYSIKRALNFCLDQSDLVVRTMPIKGKMRFYLPSTWS
ncbi:MAG TPA: polysaccharide ABC transporter ATP-binding protein [Panacibacter sp.]|nr:polysaccharide ABC transporter ATP-binding protein [Panacibacter sp.]HNP46542.1 polysaccharide ABC transporter ATP-binding protein [Panacibacter sp.]